MKNKMKCIIGQGGERLGKREDNEAGAEGGCRGRRRVRVMGEGGGGGKLKLGGAQGDGGSEGDGEISRTERDKEEDNEAGVCAG